MAERRPPGFNVDLGFYDSDEVLSIPRRIRAAAIGVWTLAGAYSANKLTDGLVSAEALRDRGCTPAIRNALLATEPEPLWEDAGNGAIQFTRWPKWQRTAAEIKAYRDAEAERKRKAREAKKQPRDRHVDASRGLPGDQPVATWSPGEPYVAHETNAECAPDDDTSTAVTSTDAETSGRTSGGHPAAVRTEDGNPRARTKTETETETEISTSVVALVGGSGGKAVAAKAAPAARGSRLRADWMPTPEVVAQMRASHPMVDLKAEHAKFVDYWTDRTGRDATKIDWTGTWRNWIRRADEQLPRRNGANGHRVPASDAAFAQAQALKSQPTGRLELEP